jgi:hypothetical protein
LYLQPLQNQIFRYTEPKVQKYRTLTVTSVYATALQSRFEYTVPIDKKFKYQL